MSAHYELIDHTADVGIRCRASSLAELFDVAARAMFSIVAETAGVDAAQSRPVELQADSVDELFVLWLQELLYIFESEALLLVVFEILEMTPTRLKARVAGEPIDFDRHELHTEIKGVTYHRLKVEQCGDGWIAEVIFDL